MQFRRIFPGLFSTYSSNKLFRLANVPLGMNTIVLDDRSLRKEVIIFSLTLSRPAFLVLVQPGGGRIPPFSSHAPVSINPRIETLRYGDGTIWDGDRGRGKLGRGSRRNAPKLKLKKSANGCRGRHSCL